jgi:hypothetical protein
MTQEDGDGAPRLGDALEAFFAEHGRCGELDSEVDDASVLVWRSCGARLFSENRGDHLKRARSQ